MAFKLIWSPTARLDLRELTDYISESDSAAARTFVQSIFSAVERLATFPQSGRVVPEFDNPNVREVIKRPCCIVDRITLAVEEVEIVRVWHSARGMPVV